MAEPWFCREAPSEGPGWWETVDDVGVTYWPTEKLARRYAALPVLIALVRRVLDNPEGCVFCNFCLGHDPDCPGIAALKAAGEEVE